jgi:putative ABC transport system permease protein
MKTLLLALRNLTRQKKRSFMLAGAVAFGFFVVTVIEGFVAGGVKNLGEQFAYMFGGNVLVERGYVSSDTNFSDNLISSGSEDEKKLKQSVEKIGAKIKYVNKRTLSMGTLIFEGKKTTTNISGCDFDQEMFLKDTVKLVEGSW